MNIVLKTPDEFIEYYYNDLQKTLEKYDIQISKLGIIGYLLNILGWTHYDSNQYYQHLFKESFVGTCTEEYNLRLHSSIYGYNPEYAQYATAIGEFRFDFTDLPKKPTNVYKREVYFSNLEFEVEDKKFVSECSYNFIEDGDQYYCMIYDSKDIIFIPSSTPVIRVPFHNVYQLDKYIEQITIQNYNFGTFFPWEIILDNSYLSKLDLRVGQEGEIYNPEGEFERFGTEYRIDAIKYLNRPTDNVAFLKSSTANSYILEFGSGIRGRYVPDRNALIRVYSTEGDLGNINVSKQPTLSDANFGMKLYKSNGQITQSSVTKDYLKIYFEYSEGGSNPLSGDNLRESIIKYIQSRDNLINEKDYYNIASKYMTDFKFVFRKDKFIDNIFYLQRTFRDRYQVTVNTDNITQQMVVPPYDGEMIFILDNNDIHVVDKLDNFVLKVPEEIENVIKTTKNEPVIDFSGKFVYSIYTSPDQIENITNIYFSEGEAIHGGRLSEGRYMYYVKASDNFNEVPVGALVEVYINGVNKNAVKLTWDAVEGATKYVIYGRPNKSGHFRKWTVFDKTTFIDVGTPGDIHIPVESTRELVFYPEYRRFGTVVISPFIYEYDHYMKWYKGYVLYSDLMIYFTKIIEYNQNASLPVIFFNIVYDRVNYKTLIYIKSYQDISNYIMELSIQGTNIMNVKVTENVDENTWVYEYIDSRYSLIWESVSLELTVYEDEIRIMKGQTDIFNQIYDITDQLKLLVYENWEESRHYITNIPVMEKDTFESDKNYYISKIHAYLYTNDFSENRMTTDDVQFRFLNSHVVPSYYLRFITKQKYEDFNLYLPLHLRAKIYINKDVLDRRQNEIDLNEEKNNLLEELARLLQQRYTGIDIKFYNSQIVDYIHSNRDFIKRVQIEVRDNQGTLIEDGIEKNTDDYIMAKIIEDETRNYLTRKLKVLEYTAPYFHWDVNNIDVQILFH